MRIILKVLVIFLLSQMIVLPSISQTVYKIGETRYTCYTSDENRILAMILFTEEFLRSKTELLESENTYLKQHTDSIISELDLCSYMLNSSLENSEQISILFNELESDYSTLVDSYNRYRTAAYIAGGSTIGLVILTVSLIIIR